MLVVYSSCSDGTRGYDESGEVNGDEDMASIKVTQ